MDRDRELLVEMRQVTKAFPGIVANDRVDFELRAGEIHALLGENGAGKTTLMNILSGLHEPDTGEIWLQGQPVRLGSPRAAIAAGIAMVHQHFMLVDSLTVAENIVLGQSRRILRENPQQLHRQLRALATNYGLDLDPAALIWQLSVGQQQRVEILKALYRGSKVLILDEPTAVLAPQEVEGLLQILRQLAATGMGLIFISHKLKEVTALCDRVTILRDGCKIATVAASSTDEHLLAEMMVGREVRPTTARESATATATQGPPALRLDNLWVHTDRGLPALRGLTLQVEPGEIVGIAGVDGNGQRELEEAIAGLRAIASGTLDLEGQLAHIPSDRYALGLMGGFSVADNLVLRDVGRPPFSWRGLLQPGKIIAHALNLVQQYAIRTPTVRTAAGQLSGGNAQRVVLARELTRNHRVILAAQPTRGLDIGAVEDVRQRLLARRREGAAVLLISTELEEVLSISDRIAVLYEGAIVGIVAARDADVRQLGLMMAGRTADVEAAV